MSSWDRQAALKKYQMLFATSRDAQTVMDELGSPTKLAIELAASYVPTRPPSALARALEECPVALEDLLRDPNALAADYSELITESELKPETWIFDMEPEAQAEPAPEPEEETSGRVRVGALIAWLIPAVVIGLPVTVVLVCVGIPFLGAGAWLIYMAVHQALRFIGALRLVSDMLLTAGAAMILSGIGLALCWLGVWLSVELCWLWVGRVLIGLGRRICIRGEAA